MTAKYPEIQFTASVRDVQTEQGSRQMGQRLADRPAADDRLSPTEIAFIAARDSFYLATVNSDGWPYVQHRGGPRGFLRVLGERLLGFADYSGNRQYISLGNARANDRVSLFLVDYPNRARLKVLAHMEAVDLAERPELAATLVDADYRAKVERGILFHVVAHDWNCPQHITPRFAEDELMALGWSPPGAG
jgi:uncharacterized protein